MPLYFAYGSCADPDHFAHYGSVTAGLAPIAVAGLSGHRLVFRRGNIEDLEDNPALSVWGSIFDVTDEVLQRLDVCATENKAPVARSQGASEGEAAVDVRPIRVRMQVTVRVNTKGREVTFNGNQCMTDQSDIIVMTHRLVAPVPDIVRATDDQLRSVFSAALRSDLPAGYFLALCDAASAIPRVRVSDIVPGQPDNTGVWIIRVYSKAEPFFAVYSTDKESVLIQYADDELTAQRQRETIAPLGSLRWRIYGLIDRDTDIDPFWQWMLSFIPFIRRWLRNRRRSRAFQLGENVNVRVAATLAEALTGSRNAEAQLQQVYDDVVSKKLSVARLAYVASAAVLSAFGVAIFLCLRHQSLIFDQEKHDLWLAAASGVVGALFSIATAIRGRTVAITIGRRDNVIDAVLRVSIGAVAAGALLLMLQAKFAVNTSALGANLPSVLTWQEIALFGFVAGFTERLVPDLLAKGVSGGATGTR